MGHARMLFFASTKTFGHILELIIERRLTSDVVKHKLALVDDGQRIDCGFNTLLFELLSFPPSKSPEAADGYADRDNEPDNGEELCPAKCPRICHGANAGAIFKAKLLLCDLLASRGQCSNPLSPVLHQQFVCPNQSTGKKGGV